MQLERSTRVWALAAVASAALLATGAEVAADVAGSGADQDVVVPARTAPSNPPKPLPTCPDSGIAPRSAYQCLPIPDLRCSDQPSSRREIEPFYNADYMFGISRALADSSSPSFARPLGFILTIPFDLALLPFAAIGGFF